MLALEHELRDLIAPYTGDVAGACAARRGFSADFTGVIDAAEGTMFLKAVRADSREVESLRTSCPVPQI